MVLGALLAYGNYMNGGTAKGQADGFNLADLKQARTPGRHVACCNACRIPFHGLTKAPLLPPPPPLARRHPRPCPLSRPLSHPLSRPLSRPLIPEYNLALNLAHLTTRRALTRAQVAETMATVTHRYTPLHAVTRRYRWRRRRRPRIRRRCCSMRSRRLGQSSRQRWASR